MPIRSDGEETRNRLLRAAGEAFGRNGYQRVTNKDIGALSGANSAAVSYYFRDKAGLYREAWAYLQAASSEKYVRWIDGSRAEGLVLLKQLAKALFDWMHDEECWDSEILRREVNEPTGILDEPERDAVLAPLKKELTDCLCGLSGCEEPGLDIVLGVQGFVAGLRSAFQTDCVRGNEWSPDEIFESVYQVFLRAMDLSAPRSRNHRKTSRADQHPELGVTDEVGPFTLKPLTRQDLLIMRKVEAEAKKSSVPSHEDRGPDGEDDEPRFLQPELW